MKKEYLKPIARSHELRCRSMVAQSPQSLDTHTFKIMRSSSNSDPDTNYDSAEPTVWAD